MEVMQSQSSLNPNAPIFIPMSSYQAVEDFSDQWWDLVHSSPFFRDYWLQDCFLDQDPLQSDSLFPAHDDLDLVLPDFDAYLHKQEKEKEEKEEEERRKKKEKEKEKEKEIISIAALKWNKSGGGKALEPPRMLEKAPKIVKNGVKVSPRTIHQPR